MSRAIMNEVKNAIRSKYAWPGGYRLLIVMGDGEFMHTECAQENFNLIARDTRDGIDSGWVAAGVDVYWEGPPAICCQCNGEIESEYGDPENEEG